MEIRHIPGKGNLADTITRQVKTNDQVYFGEMKQLDKDLVDAIRISVESSDAEVQDKLNQLCNNDEIRDKKYQAFKQVVTGDSNSFNAISAVAQSTIQLDKQFKQRLFNSLKEDY